MIAKPLSIGRYVLAYLALLILAGISLVFAKAIHWVHWDLVVVLTVAAFQAGIVVWVFMHLSEANFQTRFSIGVGVSLLLTLLFLTASDVATRDVQPPGPRPGPTHGFYKR